MQLNTFLSIALLVFTASATRPSLREVCSDAEIISEKTFTASGNREIKIVTKSCPGLAALKDITTTQTPSSVRSRQSPVLQCNSVPSCKFRACQEPTFSEMHSIGAVVGCITSGAQPGATDCDHLTDALISANEVVPVPPGNVFQASLGTCLYQYANLDVVTYDVCTSTFVCSYHSGMTISSLPYLIGSIGPKCSESMFRKSSTQVIHHGSSLRLSGGFGQ